MKKFVSICLCILTLFSLSVSGMAAEPVASDQVAEEVSTGSGVSYVEELEISQLTRATARSATKSRTYTYDGDDIADISITGTFRYDGSTVTVSSMSYSQDTYNGWTFTLTSFTTSGGTIRLRGTLSKLTLSVSVDMTLTCDEDGNIS